MLSIEEKRNELKTYCETRGGCMAHGSYKEECPLWNDAYDSFCYEGASAEVIERNHALIFGEPVSPQDTSDAEEVNDVVNHPSHYTNGGMECIDEMVMLFGVEAVKNFCLCNAWKYRRRALYKNGEEDIKKSHWYIAKFKELKELDNEYDRTLGEL